MPRAAPNPFGRSGTAWLSGVACVRTVSCRRNTHSALAGYYGVSSRRSDLRRVSTAGVWVPGEKSTLHARLQAAGPIVGDPRQSIFRAAESSSTTLDAELLDLAPGRCTIRSTYREGLGQQHGFFHAGVASAIGDSACGYAAYTLFPPDADVLTSEFKINLLAPQWATISRRHGGGRAQRTSPECMPRTHRSGSRDCRRAPLRNHARYRCSHVPSQDVVSELIRVLARMGRYGNRVFCARCERWRTSTIPAFTRGRGVTAFRRRQHRSHGLVRRSQPWYEPNVSFGARPLFAVRYASGSVRRRRRALSREQLAVPTNHSDPGTFPS